MYLFMFFALGLCCWVWAFSNLASGSHSPAAVCGLLIAVASLVAKHGLLAHGLSSRGSQALEHKLSSGGAQA